LGDLARAEMVGERIYVQLEDKEDMFPVLVKDAEMQGVGVNSDFIEQFVRAGLPRMPMRHCMTQ